MEIFNIFTGEKSVSSCFSKSISKRESVLGNKGTGTPPPGRAATALKAMLCMTVPIQRIATTTIGRNVLTFITGEMSASICFSVNATVSVYQLESVLLPSVFILTYTIRRLCSDGKR